MAAVHEGIRWQKGRDHAVDAADEKRGVVRSTPKNGFIPGVPSEPRTDIFETPPIRYLSVRPEDQRRGGYKRDWSQAKVIVNRATRGRGPWRLSAFADEEGIACDHLRFAVWPQGTDDQYDVTILTAVLNGPLANLWIKVSGGKRDISLATVRNIPLPLLNHERAAKIRKLVKQYTDLTGRILVSDEASHVLRKIDAEVLDGYQLKPRQEQALLAYFSGYKRQTPFDFPDYISEDDERGGNFSLSERLRPGFGTQTFENLVAHFDERGDGT